jgi:hypothetical protein
VNVAARHRPLLCRHGLDRISFGNQALGICAKVDVIALIVYPEERRTVVSNLHGLEALLVLHERKYPAFGNGVSKIYLPNETIRIRQAQTVVSEGLGGDQFWPVLHSILLGLRLPWLSCHAAGNAPWFSFAHSIAATVGNGQSSFDDLERGDAYLCPVLGIFDVKMGRVMILEKEHNLNTVNDRNNRHFA